jgi:hypothetical protein
MIQKPMDVLEFHEVRKTKKQKTDFLLAAMSYAQSQRYSSKIEEGSFGCRNLVIGDPRRAKILLTAHYDTPARMWLPNFITPRCLPLYILYQLLLIAIPVGLGILAGNFVFFLTNMLPLSKILGYLVGMGLYLSLILGPANRHNANDNTSGVVTVLEILRSMPENQRQKVAFVLFDLEEAGLLGSAAYRKAHPESARQLVVNLDCVGEGDALWFIPSKAVKADEGLMEALSGLCQSMTSKRLHLHCKGLFFYPSDQLMFPKSMAVAAFQRMKFFGPYLGKIHTGRDRTLDVTNVNILRAAIISLISQH